LAKHEERVHHTPKAERGEIATALAASISLSPPVDDRGWFVVTAVVNLRSLVYIHIDRGWRCKQMCMHACVDVSGGKSSRISSIVQVRWAGKLFWL
jgi:hypothetical protein